MVAQSVPGTRVTVTKPLTPKMDATPGVSNTAAAKGLPAAASALLKLMVDGSVVSRSYLVASGLGVEDGVTVAMSGIVRHRRYGRVMGPTARFTQLVQGPEDELALDEAALLIAAHAYPDLDVERELARLDDLAAGCPDPTIDGWRQHLFVDLGFTGETKNYYDARNSFLNDVLDSRRGLPITLSVVGIEVGRRLGLRFEGIGMPGHFLLRAADSPDTFFDPFQGGAVLDRLGCVQRFNAVNPPTAPFLGTYLDPIGPRAILGRMLQNVKGAYTRQGDTAGLRWVFDLRLAIPGTPPLEGRDGARLQAAGGRFDVAADQLEDLADRLPESADDLLTEARALRARLN
ncbi:MAG: hypothetical protein QOI56_393 [Actinomycetota bacterium]|nr:hypothetical protein [Actinomycetota bacterium]